MDKIKSIYKEAFKSHGYSADAVCWPKGRQDLRFEKLIKNFPDSEGEILDYGSGLGHLKDYLKKIESNFEYFGVEIVEEFISESRARFPEVAQNIRSLDQFNSSSDFFDYIVCSGTFNIRYYENTEKNDDFFKKNIETLFARTKKCLSLNLMTDQVDFQQDGAWHVNPEGFLAFVSQNLSKRFIIDSSYMPYEYTVTIFKDDTILKPENVFRI